MPVCQYVNMMSRLDNSSKEGHYRHIFKFVPGCIYSVNIPPPISGSLLLPLCHVTEYLHTAARHNEIQTMFGGRVAYQL